MKCTYVPFKSHQQLLHSSTVCSNQCIWNTYGLQQSTPQYSRLSTLSRQRSVLNLCRSIFYRNLSMMASNVATKTTKSVETFQTSEDLYYWLTTWPTVSAQLKLVVIGLRRRQVSEPRIRSYHPLVHGYINSKINWLLFLLISAEWCSSLR